MQLMFDLYRDETGSVVSAEAVIVGTLAIAGTSVGMNATSQAIDSELAELAAAIRHLDQSFTVSEERSAQGWAAGSSYTQPQVDTAAEISNIETETETGPETEIETDAKTDTSDVL